MSGCLYCKDGCEWCNPTPDPERHPDWFTASKHSVTLTKRVRAGLHPFGFALGPEYQKCGGCGYKYVNAYGKRYLKCGLIRPTKGPGTDLRAKWRSCEYWIPEDGVDRSDAFVTPGTHGTGL